MKHRTCSLSLAALVVFGGAPAAAQTLSNASSTAPTNSAAAAQAKADAAKPAGRPDPIIQRIHNQDAGSRIDELRVGGETQSITVQPAANVPPYEIKPIDASRSGGTSESGTAGSRFWNVFKF
jgi:long-subunit fatty acid transport protein